ncbi:MAG: acyl-ACP thioesterase domain-containing protein [Acidimicrobiales bacterium]
MQEYVGRPAHGRTFTSTRVVHLSDAGVTGLLRVDGIARFLQEVASDDWADSGIEADDVWVARRTSWRRTPGGRWPRLGETIGLTTWCGGTGAAWAERRTDLEVGGTVAVEAASLWVPIGADGRPRRVRREFFDVYGAAAAGRRVPGRVSVPPVDATAERRRWALRRSDLDVVGHVNNAAVWCAVAEVVPEGVSGATVTHHGALEGDDDVTLIASGSRLWLTVGDDVRVSGEFEVD